VYRFGSSLFGSEELLWCLELSTPGARERVKYRLLLRSRELIEIWELSTPGENSAGLISVL
jgi:hypothetical protein